MKQFILGILVMMCFSAAAIKTDILTVKPAKPTSVVAQDFAGGSEIPAFIRKYVQKGYILREISGSGQGWYVVVMEKY